MWQTLNLNTEVFTLLPTCLLVVIMVKYCCLPHTLVLQICRMSSLTSVHLYTSVVYNFVASIADIVNNFGLLAYTGTRTSRKSWRSAIHRTYNVLIFLWRWIRLYLLKPCLGTCPYPRQTIECGAKWEWRPTERTRSARGKKYLSAQCDISDFCPGADDVSALHGSRAALIANQLQTANQCRATSLKSEDLSVSLYPSETPYRYKVTWTSSYETVLSYFIPTIFTQFSKGTTGQAIIERTNAIQRHDVPTVLGSFSPSKATFWANVIYCFKDDSGISCG
jgi:hypothetical protein